MGWGGLPWSSLPLSTRVICVGHPLCLVVGVRSHVHCFMGARGAGRHSHGVVGLALGGDTG